MFPSNKMSKILFAVQLSDECCSFKPKHVGESVNCGILLIIIIHQYSRGTNFLGMCEGRNHESIKAGKTIN